MTEAELLSEVKKLAIKKCTAKYNPMDPMSVGPLNVCLNTEMNSGKRAVRSGNFQSWAQRTGGNVKEFIEKEGGAMNTLDKMADIVGKLRGWKNSGSTGPSDYEYQLGDKASTGEIGEDEEKKQSKMMWVILSLVFVTIVVAFVVVFKMKGKSK